MDQVILKAYAKINLNLKVMDRRADGYHNITSLMQSISLCDQVKITKIQQGINLACGSADIPGGRDNTAYRAAVEFLRIWERGRKTRPGEKMGVEISIDKEIPIGAGLAGGSADAAAVIFGLNQLFEANYSAEELQEMGLKIGADVPFCLMGGRAEVSGKGEVLRPSGPVEQKWIVLANPGYEVSTQWAYEEIDRLKGSGVSFEGLANDFEVVVLKKHPEVADAKQQLAAAGAELAQMTGSGPTVFGIFSDKIKAERAFEELLAAFPRTYIASFVNHGVEIIT
ncbi:MAG: 4-(cytidine 5'-diphospho)-2-C-methyl-D-erythritol kinase [Candidatus Margulisiibacteriota bacterium]